MLQSSPDHNELLTAVEFLTDTVKMRCSALVAALNDITTASEQAQLFTSQEHAQMIQYMIDLHLQSTQDAAERVRSVIHKQTIALCLGA
jgi:ABC-type transporter Mla subunit MlaD